MNDRRNGDPRQAEEHQSIEESETHLVLIQERQRLLWRLVKYTPRARSTGSLVRSK